MTDGGARVRPVTRPAVVMLARNPRVAGKTRLTSHLPEDAAGALRAALLLDTIAGALGAGWPLHLFITPPDSLAEVRALLADDAALGPAQPQWLLHAQSDGDLGARMIGAMQHTLAAGHDAVVLVGSDLPALPPAALVDAVALLDRPGLERQVIFGPARDGGFYLVAARQAWSQPFTGATWSHGAVLAETEARARQAGLAVSRVRGCDDVDTMADLDHLLRTQPAPAAPRTRAWAATR